MPTTRPRRFVRRAVMVLAGCVVALFVALDLRHRSVSVPSDAYRHIHDGMTKQEVIAVLGEPHREDGLWTYYRYEPFNFLQVGFGNDPLNVGFDEDDLVNWISL